MIYNNLLAFLVAIFVFTTRTPGAQPLLPPWPGWLLGALAVAAFWWLARRRFGRVARPRDYFRCERRLTLAALVVYAGLVYVLDLKYYLVRFVPDLGVAAVVDAAGLLAFFGLLAVVWWHGASAYGRLFGRTRGPWAFVRLNFRTNVPVVLPWLLLSLLFDALALAPLPWLERLLASPWGDLAGFALFVVVLVVVLPPLVRRLWRCRPLEPGPVRQAIESFCAAQGYRLPVYLWPLFDGEVLTAGIMGIAPGCRYLLVTPALLRSLTLDELEAVLAHEIGHVRHRHLLCYLALFVGFAYLAGALAELVPTLVMATPLFPAAQRLLPLPPDQVLLLLGAAPLLVCMVVYFRFVFGFFIRNFERQADLNAYEVQGRSGPLVRAFEKIAFLTGSSLSEKNWHHFGLGERIDFLRRVEADPRLGDRHHRKIRLALAAYLLAVALAGTALSRVDLDSLAREGRQRYLEQMLRQRLARDPADSLWLQLLGELFHERQLERQALEAYERALSLAPFNAEVLNNLAWLLLTARDHSLRDARRALTLARTAATLERNGHVLDTLATAFWANGLVEDAVLAELEAMQLDPEHRAYYQRQIERFKTRQWRGGPPAGRNRQP